MSTRCTSGSIAVSLAQQTMSSVVGTLGEDSMRKPSSSMTTSKPRNDS